MSNDSQPLVSIITRTKNRGLLLERAVESVLSQTFQDWEQIVVNDGGDSAQLNALARRLEEKLKGRLRIIENDRTLGRWGAANAGLIDSRGKYFVLLDDDDTWMPSFLETVVPVLCNLESSNVKAVATQSVAIFEEVTENVIRELHREPYNPHLLDVTLFRMAGGAGRYLQPNAILFSSSLRDEVGLFNEELPVIGDWEYNVRVLQKFDFYVVPEIHACYHHRVHTTGVLANSIFACSADHQLQYTKRLNQALREDLQHGRCGLGFLMNAARTLTEQDHEMRELKKNTEALKIRLEEMQTSLSQKSNLSTWFKKAAVSARKG
jgi:glycosyltransferase involved in cell wall biosynthesis